MRDLINIDTNETLREATEAECEASDAAALADGGVGAISVEVDGESVTCYVEA